MRLREIALRGLTRFAGAEPVRIDLDALGPGLIALVGPNGAGKTTLLEAVPAALHKQFASRPASLYEYAAGKDAFIECTFDDGGRELKVRVQIDADRRTCESYVFEDGRSLTTGRAAEFDAEILRRFGSRDLLLASVFAAQGKQGNFLGLKKTDRKGLFIELLGLAMLEVLATHAAAAAADEARKLDRARQHVADLDAELEDLPLAEQAVMSATESTGTRQAMLEDARASEREWVAIVERLRGAGARLAALQQAKAASAGQNKEAGLALERAEFRPPWIRGQADARRTVIQVRHSERLEPIARERANGALAAITRREEGLRASLENVPDAATLEQERKDLAAEKRRLDAADVKYEALLDVQAQALFNKASADAAVTIARRARNNEVSRLQEQVELLVQAPCTAAPSWCPEAAPAPVEVDLAGTCPLLADAKTAEARLAELLANPVLEEDAGHAQAIAKADAAVQDVQAGAGAMLQRKTRRPLIETRQDEITEALARVRAAAGAQEQLRLAGEERIEVQSRLDADLVAAAETVRADLVELQGVEDALERDLATAAAEISRAQERHDLASVAHAEAAAALDRFQEEIGRLTLEEAERKLEASQGSTKKAEDLARDADRALERARAALQALQARAGQRAEMQEKVAAVERELGDWRLLATALGRDGVQALEIDAAGPEVARITNDLLEACYGPRFSITFETLREKRSAAGEFVEAFDIQVFDRGETRPVEALSGGERVIVGEAIGLAISIFNARKSGIRWQTLFRDETAGALDPKNAGRYVAMLRRAMQLGGFHQVLFVAHVPEVYEASDVQVHVADGAVRIGALREAA